MDGIIRVPKINEQIVSGANKSSAKAFGDFKVDSSGNASFADTLKNAIGQVNNLQIESNRAMQELATGKTDNVADVMILAEKADVALKLMIQVRNKIIDAYQEVMKMQV